ncbi:class I adenylate-forming enzyme family protein [Streptomyces sp. ISL-100]|uniref:class I adenylate-forming enzyme family protein n=1 Tax=Streptomyces sp. ISL-100 TaxID=2819173 RepID=UPI001BE90D65|nr:AMP-binding protein [Streptomyces sp. ISL-100]MBT2399846.1 AMP-binding protein [Streptomyces sp. ISL-100]
MSWMTLLLERGRQRYGERIAIRDGERHVTYAELDRRTDSLATALLKLGVERGHRVAVVSHNRLEVLETYFALGKVGATAVPLHYGAVAEEVAAAVQRFEVSAIVGEAGLPGTADPGAGRPVLLYDSDEYRRAVTCDAALPPGDIPDDELMFILQTSATTGRPKGVCVDHHSLRSVALGYLTDVRPGPDQVFLHCGPLSHGAMVIPLIYLAAGATVALMRMFSPQECLAAIRRDQVTHLFLVPDMLRFLLKTRGLSSAGPTTLQELIYGAAPMPRQLLLDAQVSFGCGFRQLYGLTEAGGPVVTLPPADHDYTPGEARGRAASIGRATMGTVFRTLDDHEHPSPTGRTGELWVRSPAVMRRYWKDPEATAEVLRDGWIRTGDLGTVDEQGYIHLAGRVKDVIFRGGQKVYPAEIEQVLLGHPAVREACVVGVPSDEWGELPVAYVVVSRQDTELTAALRDLARRHLARYKRPEEFRTIPELPRNAAGKIDRRSLRETAAGESAGAAHPELKERI